MSKLPYSKQDLHATGSQREFGRDAAQAAFLLGGIGTGNISLGSRGDLRDWEIFNRSAKGQRLPYSFFSIAIIGEGRAPITRVLESRLVPPFTESHGFQPGTLAGLPRLEDSCMRGEYPLVYVEFEDTSLPVDIMLEAYTPFVPHEPDDSGLPATLLTYRVKNTGEDPLEVTVVGSLLNAVGYTGLNRFGSLKSEGFGGNINEFREEMGLRGLHLHSGRYGKDSLLHGGLSLATTNSRVTVKRHWLRSGWWDNLREFWDDLSEDGLLTDLGYSEPSEDGKTDVGSIGAVETIGPGEAKEFRFVLSWYLPNRVRSWSQVPQGDACGCEQQTVRNRYAARFDSAWDVSRYVVSNLERLDGATRAFHDALFGSTLPSHVLDALSANITVIRSPTCFWLEDGSFFGYEGCFDEGGCCSGNCTHVWNYAQTLAFLFPSLERSMRRTEFQVETDEDGKMNFRAYREIPGERSWDAFEPASDGQCGSIMRLYREWKMNGDTAWMEGLWPGARRAMDFACTRWDTDGDGVTDGKQHNTYDIEFYGPNPLSGVMFLGALRTATRMAEAAGDYEAAQRYGTLFEMGRANLDEALWNGEYYVQKLEDVDAYKYQHGVGCLADQLLGQANAHVAGLGYLLPPAHVKRAIGSVFRHNLLTDFSLHDNCQRVYALNDEVGLIACTWPGGGRPRIPFPYSHEVWTGIEYQVAAHLIFEGLVDEGLTVVKAVRDRHDGVRRNPWNEVECGHHYARSMASWGLLVALSGFSFDMVQKEMSFDPAINADDFRCFWSTGTAWGTYRQRKDPETGERDWDIDVLHGSLEGVKVNGRDL
ncbi:MAG: hypothetical protein JSV27_02140 [Candidatus Bathyarchaeota archaeon]|nr:MAG: hypothetical protein JSV27_02140 [Candidatus Bathyarchaeota archaeon]